MEYKMNNTINYMNSNLSQVFYECLWLSPWYMLGLFHDLLFHLQCALALESLKYIWQKYTFLKPRLVQLNDKV